MVPGIASWPICESEGFQFAGVVEAGKLVPHVQTVEFDAVGAEPKIRSALAFCRSQIGLGGPRLFGAQWDNSRLVLCNSQAPMVLYGNLGLDIPLALSGLTDCGSAGLGETGPDGFVPDWKGNLDRHFWNFLSIVARTTASRTLILGFGPESCKLGIADGAIHEMGRFDSAEAIVRKFRSTARARRKITYFAGARRRKKTSAHPIGPLALAVAFAQSAANAAGPGADPTASWQLDAAGWPLIVPETAGFADYARRLATHRDSLAWLDQGLKSDCVSWFRTPVGSTKANLSRRDRDGLVEWRALPVRALDPKLRSGRG